MRKIVSIALLLLITACGTASKYHLKDVEPLIARHGYIVGVFSDTTSDDTWDFEYIRSMEFRSLSNAEIDGEIYADNTFSKPLYEDELFALSLPAGKYEFYNFTMTTAGAFGSSTWYAEDDFSIPFEVIAGKAIYIGDIKNYMVLGENMFGGSVPAGGYFKFIDNAGKDGFNIVKKFPALKNIEMFNGTIRSGNVHESIVKFE